MNLNAPKQVTFIVAAVLAVLGLIGYIGFTPLTGVSFWLVLVGFLVLAAGNMVTDL